MKDFYFCLILDVAKHLPFHIRIAVPLIKSISITLPRVSVIAANLSLGEMETDNASRNASASPYLGYTGVAGSDTAFSFNFDTPVSFFACPPQPNHPLIQERLFLKNRGCIALLNYT